VDLPSDCRLSVEENPSWADRELIDEGLGAYNAPFLRDPSYDYFAVFVRDDGGAIRAGLVGHCYAGWLFIALLWVDQALRHRGIGSGLIAAAEQRGRDHGCHSAWVDTFSFQAPAFYRKLGYREFARLPLPPDHERIFLRKSLVPEQPHADAS
jgi:GNAT superfamily N-acetyltransferase